MHIQARRGSSPPAQQRHSWPQTPWSFPAPRAPAAQINMTPAPWHHYRQKANLKTFLTRNTISHIVRSGSPLLCTSSVPGCVDMLSRPLERYLDTLWQAFARQPENLFSSPRITQSAMHAACTGHHTDSTRPNSAPTDTWHLSQHSSTAALLPLPVPPALIWRMAPPVQRCLAHDI